MSAPGRLPQTAVCGTCGAVYWTAVGHMCRPRGRRLPSILASVAGWLLIPVPDGHRQRCGCPLCNRAERQAREELGVPRRHPEWVTRELPEALEERLAALAEELWPGDEYAEIVANPWQEDCP